MVNSVVLVGKVGSAPESRVLEPAGTPKTTFSLAVDRPAKRTEGEVTTDWFRVELWETQAQVAAEYIRKGSLVGVRGRLVPQPDGTVVIRATEIRLLGKRDDRTPAGEAAS